jgi:hypothetical protein
MFTNGEKSGDDGAQGGKTYPNRLHASIVGLIEKQFQVDLI